MLTPQVTDCRQWAVLPDIPMSGAYNFGHLERSRNVLGRQLTWDVMTTRSRDWDVRGRGGLPGAEGLQGEALCVYVGADVALQPVAAALQEMERMGALFLAEIGCSDALSAFSLDYDDDDVAG